MYVIILYFYFCFRYELKVEEEEIEHGRECYWHSYVGLNFIMKDWSLSICSGPVTGHARKWLVIFATFNNRFFFFFFEKLIQHCITNSNQYNS